MDSLTQVDGLFQPLFSAQITQLAVGLELTLSHV